MAQGQVLLWAFLFYRVREGLSGRVVPLHHHCHRTDVSFTAVLDVDVPQHCVSGQRSLVSNVSVKVFYALCVSAGEADQRHTVTCPYECCT